MAVVRTCDVCKVRHGHTRLSHTHVKWKHGIRIDTCQRHETDLFIRRNWQSWQMEVWLKVGAPADMLRPPHVVCHLDGPRQNVSIRQGPPVYETPSGRQALSDPLIEERLRLAGPTTNADEEWLDAILD